MNKLIFWMVTIALALSSPFLIVTYVPIANQEQVQEAMQKFGCVKTSNFIMTNTRTNVDASERLYKCSDGFEYPYSDIKWWATMELRKSK